MFVFSFFSKRSLVLTLSFLGWPNPTTNNPQFNLVFASAPCLPGREWACKTQIHLQTRCVTPLISLTWIEHLPVFVLVQDKMLEITSLYLRNSRDGRDYRITITWAGVWKTMCDNHWQSMLWSQIPLKDFAVAVGSPSHCQSFNSRQTSPTCTLVTPKPSLPLTPTRKQTSYKK